jgi:hypothetical protein
MDSNDLALPFLRESAILLMGPQRSMEPHRELVPTGPRAVSWAYIEIRI